VGRERDLALAVKAVDRFEQPERGDLQQIVERLMGALISQRQQPRERQETPHERLPGMRVTLRETLKQRSLLTLATRVQVTGPRRPRRQVTDRPLWRRCRRSSSITLTSA